MANPTTITLVANTAQTATVDGVWSKLLVVPAVTTAAVFGIGQGTATAGTAGEYLSTGTEPRCVPTASTNGTTTTVSLISATAGAVTVRPPLDGED